MRILVAAAMTAGLAGNGWAATCPAPQNWSQPERHLAARSPAMKFALKPGGTTQIGLLPRQDVKLASGRISREGYAGVAAVDVPRAGVLQVILDNKVFADVVRDGKPLALAGEPRAHGCPGIAKVLTFKVRPGRYLIELSGSPSRLVKLATTLRYSAKAHLPR